MITSTPISWWNMPPVLSKAKQHYEDGHRVSGLLPFAGHLYRFRHKPDYAKELMGLRHDMLRHQPLLIERSPRYTPSELALMFLSASNALATYYQWFSQQLAFKDRDEHKKFWEEALKISHSGYLTGKRYQGAGETYRFQFFRIALVYARLTSKEAEREAIFQDVRNGVKNISDLQQRRQIYAMLGSALRYFGKDWIEGVWWSTRGNLLHFFG